MEETLCIQCGNPIPEGRLKALPHTMTCVECSIVGKKKAFRVITGKTTYHELEFVSEAMYNILTAYERKTNGAFYTSPNKPTPAEMLTNGSSADAKLFEK